MLYKGKFLNSFRVALVFPTMFHFLFFISSSCNAILLFQHTMCLAAIYVIVIVQSAGLNSLSTLNFFKEGHVFEILDACIIDTQPLLINSLGQCASQCGMNSLCIAFDYCSHKRTTLIWNVPSNFLSIYVHIYTTFVHETLSQICATCNFASDDIFL